MIKKKIIQALKEFYLDVIDIDDEMELLSMAKFKMIEEIEENGAPFIINNWYNNERIEKPIRNFINNLTRRKINEQ